MFTCWWCNPTPIMLVTVSLSSGYTVKRNLQKAKVMADTSVVYAAIHISVRIHPRKFRSEEKLFPRLDVILLTCYIVSQPTSKSI
jgi:hypothetical protein